VKIHRICIPRLISAAKIVVKGLIEWLRYFESDFPMQYLPLSTYRRHSLADTQAMTNGVPFELDLSELVIC
jgi:hypothetical protein